MAQSPDHHNPLARLDSWWTMKSVDLLFNSTSTLWTHSKHDLIGISWYHWTTDIHLSPVVILPIYDSPCLLRCTKSAWQFVNSRFNQCPYERVNVKCQSKPKYQIPNYQNYLHHKFLIKFKPPDAVDSIEHRLRLLQPITFLHSVLYLRFIRSITKLSGQMNVEAAA